MTAWHFELRSGVDAAVDATVIQRKALVGNAQSAIERLPIEVNGRGVPIGEVFEVRMAESDRDQIHVQGTLDNVHGLAAEHDQGEFIVEGSVGDYFAAGASGGVIRLDGDAGDCVGGALGGRRVGMRGGLIRVSGSVGSYAAHRMRRGVLVVEDDAGSALAASMVAGTVVLGGESGPNLGCEMNRGTVMLCRRRSPDHFETSRRYSKALPFAAGFLRLYREPMIRDLIHPLLGNGIHRVRADTTRGGQGEILFVAE